jgi:hypothetical protein
MDPGQGKPIVSDLVDELDVLMIQHMVDAPLQNTTSMANLDTISRYNIVNELLNSDGYQQSVEHKIKYHLT